VFSEEEANDDCVGDRGTRGIVVAADTEESSGYMKSSETKILSVLGGVQLGKQTPKKPNVPTGACLISGAGDFRVCDRVDV